VSAGTELSVPVAVVGAGPVGATLACALAAAGVPAAVIEAAAPAASGHPAYDDRPLALALGSCRILESLGVWQALAGRATPIHAVHVSERGGTGIVRLEAADQGVEALGRVVAARDVGAALESALGRAAGLALVRPARLAGITRAGGRVRLDLESDAGPRRLDCALLVAADGARSRVRELLALPARERACGQSAITANVTPVRAHRHVAYERFTAGGPLALLPMAAAGDGAGDRCGLVWSMPPALADELMALDDAAFLARLEDAFGGRLGGFRRVGRRERYDLARVRSRAQVAERVALIGNAAHTLHPVAGQGLNLGLRDAAALAEAIVDAGRGGADPGAAAALARFARWRAPDRRQVTAFTDALVALFSNRLAPLVLARNAGLTAFDLLPPLKRELGRRAMGLAGRQPRLARGVGL